MSNTSVPHVQVNAGHHPPATCPSFDNISPEPVVLGHQEVAGEPGTIRHGYVLPLEGGRFIVVGHGGRWSLN